MMKKFDELKIDTQIKRLSGMTLHELKAFMKSLLKCDKVEDVKVYGCYFPVIEVEVTYLTAKQTIFCPTWGKLKNVGLWFEERVTAEFEFNEEDITDLIAYARNAKHPASYTKRMKKLKTEKV